MKSMSTVLSNGINNSVPLFKPWIFQSKTLTVVSPICRENRTFLEYNIIPIESQLMPVYETVTPENPWYHRPHASDTTPFSFCPVVIILLRLVIAKIYF